MTIRVGETASAAPFPQAARQALGDAQLRRNVRHATDVIRGKRARVVAEMPDWEALRTAGAAIKAFTLAHLDFFLEQFEARCRAAGGQVHWAQDADEAVAIAQQLIRAATPADGHAEVIKVKTMTSDEVGLNRALEQSGIVPWETDLADMIVQMGHDRPSHIVVPALHKNRHQVGELFREQMHRPELSDAPQELTGAARSYLRDKFLNVRIGVSGANFAIAETGAICVVESEGNGRMCLTLPDVLITLVGIEKVIPRFQDLEVFLQLLPRSATGERMNPYNSIWTGVHAGDGPRTFHVILLDNGRTRLLAHPRERETLQCIRCAACLNVCPVYRETGGHAYGSIYSGPIGAILTPQLQNLEHSRTLPYASSLCGACYEVCPVKINIPETLVHLRGRIVAEDRQTLRGWTNPEAVAMRIVGYVFRSAARYERAQRWARRGQALALREGERANPAPERKLAQLPGMLGAWTRTRDLFALPPTSFRDWWRQREAQHSSTPTAANRATATANTTAPGASPAGTDTGEEQ